MFTRNNTYTYDEIKEKVMAALAEANKQDLDNTLKITKNSEMVSLMAMQNMMMMGAVSKILFGKED